MTHPAVDEVLGYIEDNWSAGAYSDIPLERIDRDNSEQLDDNIRSHTSDLQADNLVGARFAGRSNEYVGTDPDNRLDVIVGVRIEGLHHTEHGKIDPSASLPPATAGDPVPWTELVDEIRDTIFTEVKFPSSGRSDISYKDLFIENEAPQSANYGDYYRHDFDVRFSGFETLP